MYIGLPNLGLSGYHSAYAELEAQAIAAARRNNAALWYVGNDPTGFVYEDSVGTLPATGTESIGLLLDRSYGTSNLGPEIPLNPDFNAATGWTIIQPTSGTTTISGGTLTINTIDGTFTSAAISATNAVVGRTYKYTLTISSVTVGRVQIVIGGAASSAFDAPGTYTGFLTATTATGMWVQRFLATAATVAIDQLSFKEVLGFPALQSTAGNRPTLELQANGYYQGLFDSNDFLAGPAFTGATSDWFVWAGSLPAFSTPQSLLGRRSGNNGWMVRQSASGVLTLYVGSGAALDTTSIALPAFNTPFVFSGKITNAAQSAWLNGTQFANKTAAYVEFAGGLLGISSDSGSASAAGGVNRNALVAFGTSSLSDPDRIAIERFAALLSGASYS